MRKCRLSGGTWLYGEGVSLYQRRDQDGLVQACIKGHSDTSVSQKSIARIS